MTTESMTQPATQSASRRPLDAYETAPWQVDALLDYVPEIDGEIWCPCVGDWSLLNRLSARRPYAHFITGDINPACVARVHGDATLASTWEALAAVRGTRPDWVVENPPFNVEINILKHAYEYATKGVAFMARVSFTEPTSKQNPRGPWLSGHPYAKRITLERYSFTGNGSTDSATTDWLVWTKPGVTLKGPFGVITYGYKPYGYKPAVAKAA